MHWKHLKAGFWSPTALDPVNRTMPPLIFLNISRIYPNISQIVLLNIWKCLKAGYWSHWAVQTGCYTRYCQYLFWIRWIRCKDWTDLLQKNVPTVWVKIQPYVGKIDWKHLLELCSILGSELWPKSVQCKVSNDAANVQKLHILVILLYTHKIGKIIPQKLHIIFILLILNWQDCYSTWRH